MVLYGSNIKQRATVTKNTVTKNTSTSSSNINKQITSNKIQRPLNVSQIGSGDPNLRANNIIKPQTQTNNLNFLPSIDAYAQSQIPADFLPNDPDRVKKYEKGLQSRADGTSGKLLTSLFGSAPSSTSGLDNIGKGPTYAGESSQVSSDPSAVPAAQSYEEEVAPKETQTAYNDWYNNHAGKMNFNQYKKKFGIQSGSQQVALNFSVGTNFGSAGADIEIPDQYNLQDDMAQVTDAKPGSDYLDKIWSIPRPDINNEPTGINAPGFVDKKTTTFFGGSPDNYVDITSKVKKWRKDSDISPQHLVNTWGLAQTNTDLPDAVRYGGVQNYTVDKGGNFIDPLTGDLRGDGWNPLTGKYNLPTGTKVKTYGVGSEGKDGQVSANFFHGYSSNQNRIGEEGVFAAGTDMWITGREPTGSDRFGNKTIADLRASSNAGKKYNNIVSQWQANHLRNANKKNPEKQINAITNFVDKKIAQIESWKITRSEKDYYIKDLTDRRNNLMTVIGPDPLSGVRVGQEKWLDDYSKEGQYQLSRGAIGNKPDRVLTWKDLQKSGY